MECLWYSFSNLLQVECNKMKQEWNSHVIRRSRHSQVWGIPDEMFLIPEQYRYEKCGKIVNDDVIFWVFNQREFASEANQVLSEVDEQLYEYFSYVVNMKGLIWPPREWAAARLIYDTIIEVANI